MSQRERRDSARSHIPQRIKMRCGDGDRCLSGEAVNISAKGALLLIQHAGVHGRLLPGQRVEVAIAQTPQQPMFTRSDFHPATITRSHAMGPHQSIAIRFAQHQKLQASA